MPFKNYKKCPTTGKDCLSKNEADKVKISMLKKSNRRISTYSCTYCFLFHVTSGKTYHFD